MSTKNVYSQSPELMLSAAELALFAADDRRVYLAPGDVIIREGEPGDRMFVLLEGEVEITIRSVRVDYLLPGMILGEMAMIDDRPRSATATAMTVCCLAPLNPTQFRELISESPEFAVRVMSIMSARTRRLLEDEVKRQRMEEELAIGQRIQLSLLPQSCPLVPGYELAAQYRAAREVGGDLYDFIFPPNAPSRFHIVIGDVTGKGVPAALYMALSRTLFHTHALDDCDPAEALLRVNQFIREDQSSPLFLSAFYAVLDIDTGCLTYANAGHNLPLWIHAATGEVTELAARGIVLGAFSGYIPQESVCFLQPGDSVVFYTDGITEARNASGEFFDDDGLLAVVRSHGRRSADELLQAIVQAVETFSDDAPQADDFTVVVLRRRDEPQS